MEDKRFIAWSVSPDKPTLFNMKPFNGEVATVGNGDGCSFTSTVTGKFS